MSGITLLGLGPGDVRHMTLQAWKVLENTSEIYLRTGKHPAVAGFPPGLRVVAFDELYERAETFRDVYDQIVEKILELAERPEGVVYAVPGHPFVAEATGPEISRRAAQQGIPLHVVEGLSFLEPVFTALGIDPFSGLALIDAFDLAEAHVPAFPPHKPAIIAQIYSNSMASEVKLTLMEIYPDDHPVMLVHTAGSAQAVVESIPLYEIDRSLQTDWQTTLYVPPLGEGTSFESFQDIIAHLRAPDGCPWDREQTHESLRTNLLEETYELLQALDADDAAGMCEEFGDLLLQIVLHTQIAREYGEFSMPEVIQSIYSKIVKRHPHVFGETHVEGVDGVLKNWEALKAEERKLNGKEKNGILDGVALALPALAQAEQYINRAARVGFEWPDLDSVFAKIEEEFEEVRQAVQPEDRSLEIGDLFFTIVNLARWYQVDPESALRETNQRFRKRFNTIENAAREKGVNIADFSLPELLNLWEEGKLKG
jgi:tetrapyrrole methylase family protein/MazG family protein